MGEDAIKARLISHLVPYDALNVGGYVQIKDAETRKNKIRADYESFLQARASNLLPVLRALFDGREDAPHWFERWASTRMGRSEIEQKLTIHTLVRPIQHGARVVLPSDDADQLVFRID